MQGNPEQSMEQLKVNFSNEFKDLQNKTPKELLEDLTEKDSKLQELYELLSNVGPEGIQEAYTVITKINTVYEQMDNTLDSEDKGITPKDLITRSNQHLDDVTDNGDDVKTSHSVEEFTSNEINLNNINDINTFLDNNWEKIKDSVGNISNSITKEGFHYMLAGSELLGINTESDLVNFINQGEFKIYREALLNGREYNDPFNKEEETIKVQQEINVDSNLYQDTLDKFDANKGKSINDLRQAIGNLKEIEHTFEGEIIYRENGDSDLDFKTLSESEVEANKGELNLLIIINNLKNKIKEEKGETYISNSSYKTGVVNGINVSDGSGRNYNDNLGDISDLQRELNNLQQDYKNKNFGKYKPEGVIGWGDYDKDSLI